MFYGKVFDGGGQGVNENLLGWFLHHPQDIVGGVFDPRGPKNEETEEFMIPLVPLLSLAATKLEETLAQLLGAIPRQK